MLARHLSALPRLLLLLPLLPAGVLSLRTANGDDSAISEEAWPRPRIIYGIHTSNDELRYGVKLQAQFSTWAKDIPRERMLVVGPRCIKPVQGCSKSESERIWAISECNDSNRVCKVLTYMKKAYKSLETLDFDWLLGMNEDQYVNEPLLQASLARYDPMEPMALAGFGCGRKWKWDPRSKNGTIPKPDNYGEHPGEETCLFIEQNGGICGGTGIVYSKAAVKKLVERDNAAIIKDPVANVDPSMTCLLADAGVPIKLYPWRIGMRCPPYGPVPNAAIYHLEIGLGAWRGAPVAEYMHKLHDNLALVPANQRFSSPPKDNVSWTKYC